MPDQLDDARSLLSGAERVVVISGAGMSADSGVPTFRDALTGLWERYDPMELATPEAWEADPDLVWSWYSWRRELVAQAQPNAGHLAIARSPKVTRVVTQNVDDLHERAGSASVDHVHGELFADRCGACGAAYSGPTSHDAPPACAECGGRVRPGVVWFGEMLPSGPWDAATAAVTSCDVALVVGTSGLVHPAASLPRLAAESGARVVEVNPGDSGLGACVDVHVRASAAEALPHIL